MLNEFGGVQHYSLNVKVGWGNNVLWHEVSWQLPVPLLEPVTLHHGLS